MLIKDVCRECQLTKKAIKYYMEQGLISPRVLENNYRDFSEADIHVLKRISVLRRLDLNIEEIRNVLNDNSGESLLKSVHIKELQISETKTKQIMLEKLAQGVSWESINKELGDFEKKQTILQKLLKAFPGYYGRFISLHFAPFLNEPIVSEEQQTAYDEIVSFFDCTESFAISPDLQKYLDEATQNIDTETMHSISQNLYAAFQNVSQYVTDNKELLEQYIVFKNSEEYRRSPIYKLQELLKEFNKTSGYYEIFIPAMQRLSKSYRDYYKSLEAANEVFIREFPIEQEH